VGEFANRVAAQVSSRRLAAVIPTYKARLRVTGDKIRGVVNLLGGAAALYRESVFCLNAK
jgi:hypothetical protein